MNRPLTVLLVARITLLVAGFAVLTAALMAASAGFRDLIAYIRLPSVYDAQGGIHLLDGHTGRTMQISADQTGIMTRLVWSGDGRLAWASGDFVRAVMLWDGSAVRRISARAVPQGMTPVWSRDGRLAWVETTGYRQPPEVPSRLAVMVWDGGSTVELGSGYNPAWSRDGRLAWIGGVENRDILVWDGHSIEVIDHADIPHSAAVDEGPVWSDDGRLAWIHNTTRRLPTLSIWDGAATQTLDTRLGLARWLVWSGDGRLAWYTQTADGSRIHVWDGTSVIDLGPDPAENRYPIWSPDGRLVWESQLPGRSWDLMLWDGSESSYLTSNPGSDILPSWAGDGRLAWSAFHGGSYDIQVWDGRAITSALRNGALNWFPSWQNGAQIAWVRR